MEGVGKALAGAVARARELAADATACVAIITPSLVNGALARRELALAGPFVRVSFVTPSDIAASLAAPILRARGLQREPAGWLRATLSQRIAAEPLPGHFDALFREPGWMPALTASIETLEAAGVDAASLRAVQVPADLRDRCDAIAALLEALDAARAADSLASPRDEAAAALEAIERGAKLPANVPAAAVLLGDARGNRLTFDVLTAWLAARPVVRVAPAAIAALSPAVHGLTAAAPHAELVSLPALDPELTFVRTPDPVRECAEAVREAQRAIASGTPLDRIAIVLPDPSEAIALRESLTHAGIPATWQTGPPLSRAPAARFLLHALSLADGAEDVTSWYELLRQPSLRLAANVGEDASRRRGRFRRILSRARAWKRTPKIVAAVQRWAAALDETSERTPEDRLSASALCRAIETLDADLAALREPREIGAHARSLRAFLSKWWSPTPDQRLLLSVMEPWSRSDAGPPVALHEMISVLSDTLEATAHLSGGLTDQSIRVLSPMQLLGASFDLVLVTGMTEGRFPVRSSEDPILADSIIDALEREHKAGLFRSTDRVLLERRRLASIRSAAAGSLWISAPRVEMLEGRPLLPGSLVLDLASERGGEHVGHRDFDALAELRGRRGRAWPASPDAAISPLEHLLARLHSPTDAAARDAAFAALVDHPVARRLMTFARARTRVMAGEVCSELRPYADLVDPAILACAGLDGAPLSAWALKKLIDNPQAFLLSEMLGAREAPRLRDRFDPTGRYTWPAILLRAAQRVLNETGPLPPRLVEAFASELHTEAECAGLSLTDAEEADSLSRAERFAARAIAKLDSTHPTIGLIALLEDTPISDTLPWRFAGGQARRAGTGLEWVVETAPGPRSHHKEVAALLEAAARRTQQKVDALEWKDLAGTTSTPKDPHGVIAGALETLTLATAAARLGYYPADKVDPAQVDAWSETGADA